MFNSFIANLFVSRIKLFYLFKFQSQIILVNLNIIIYGWGTLFYTCFFDYFNKGIKKLLKLRLLNFIQLRSCLRIFKIFMDKTHGFQ